MQRCMFHSFVPVVSSGTQVTYLFHGNLTYILLPLVWGEKNPTKQTEKLLMTDSDAPEYIWLRTAFLLGYVDAEDTHL